MSNSERGHYLSRIFDILLFYLFGIWLWESQCHNQKWGMVFQSHPYKMGSQGLPHYIYIYVIYIYIFMYVCIYVYIYMIYVYDIYDNVIYWSPRSSPKHPYQVPGRRQSLPRCTTRREGRVCWGSLLISWAFHGNCCVILMGIPWFPWQFLYAGRGPKKFR